MNWLLSKVIGNPVVLFWLVLGAFTAGVTSGGLGAWKVQGWRLGTELQTIKAEHAKAMADADHAALIKSGEYRLEEIRMTDNVRTAENELKTATANHQRIVAGLASERLELRNALADYASGRGATQDSLASCRRDAATLGDVLADTLQREEVATGAAETHAASTRSLLAAWPRKIAKP